jgi:hypothetical protein
MTGLSKPIKLVFAMCRMRNEVDGDGFQHLLDCDSWRFAPLATEGYRLVGATQRAAVMERAAAIIDREKAKQEGSLSDENPALETLDHAFYALDRTDDLDQLIVKYIRQHQAQFVAG